MPQLCQWNGIGLPFKLKINSQLSIWRERVHIL